MNAPPLPIAIKLENMQIALVANAVHKRSKQLTDYGAMNIDYYDTAQDFMLLDKDRLAKYDLLLMADEDLEISEQIYQLCRANKIIAHIEDISHICDIYFMSLVNRGDLQIAISTNGKSPTIAKGIRLWLELIIPPIWQERLEQMAEQRLKWKENNMTMKEIMAASRDYLAKRRWFPKKVIAMLGEKK